MSTARELIIETACDLLESQGFHATGINQIVKDSGAPKGSLYHYFPEGKDEIAEEAISHAGQALADRIASNLALYNNPAEAIRRFVRSIAERVEASGYRSGAPLTTVAMETATTNERLNRACRAAYQQLLDAFAANLQSAGFSQAHAQELATLTIASIEGGILLCRTFHSGDPLRLVADHLQHVIEAALPEATAAHSRHETGSV